MTSTETTDAEWACENWCVTKNETVEYSLKWTIDKFKFCNEKVGEYLDPGEFTTKKTKSRTWQLRFYPNGHNEKSSGFVSIFVQLLHGEGVQAEYKLKLSNSGGKTFVNKTLEIHSYNKAGDDWGQTKFIERNVLLNGLSSANDKLIINFKFVAFDSATISTGAAVFDDDEFRGPLKENNGDACLGEIFGKLFDSQTLTDCVLVAENQEIGVHKAFLICRSPVFLAMFEHDTDERRQNRVVIDDVEFNVLKATIRFLYTNETPAGLSNMADKLLIVANKYALAELKTACEKSLTDTLTLENAFERLELSDKHDARRLKCRAAKFVTDHAEEFVKSQLAQFRI